MKNIYIETPLIQSLSVSRGKGSRVWMKMEALQPCGSFKARGIGYACEEYVKEGAQELISSSGGNAGLAVAYAGRKLNIPVTVVVPKTTKQRAIDLIGLEAADVIVHGDLWDESHAYALSLMTENSAYIHPFDDPKIWKGHSTIVDEVIKEGLQPDVIVLSVGGGGLLCGVVEGLKRNGLDIPIVAVETHGTNSLFASAEANKHISIESINSIATSLGAKTVAKKAFQVLSEHPISTHLVSDMDAVNACLRFLKDHRVLVEPACGASLASIYNGCDVLQDKKEILVIVCGGVGTSIEQLQVWKALL